MTGDNALTTAHRTFVSYIDRTREFYGAQGYERPYQWAHFAEVPFARPRKPLSESRLTLVTTASPWHETGHDPGSLRGAKQVWSGATAESPERLYTDDLAWDKQETHTDDVDSFLPLSHLRECVSSGRIAALAEHFHGVPTDYSQRRTTELDAPEILKRCREDAVDLALLVPL
ncbi:MAG: hypothetical protein VX614_05700 [Myxococcota bacterium]|nr:hypothetical protein [Myxococcota bacterium]